MAEDVSPKGRCKPKIRAEDVGRCKVIPEGKY
jgi:hypothetical protein